VTLQHTVRGLVEGFDRKAVERLDCNLQRFKTASRARMRHVVCEHAAGEDEVREPLAPTAKLLGPHACYRTCIAFARSVPASAIHEPKDPAWR
jgi:hypothetical protein